MKKYAYGAIVLIALTTPALAQEFYIVREPDAKECTIVETRPAAGAAVVIGDRVFTTRKDAQAQVEVLCSDDADAGVVVDDADGAVVIEKN